LYATALINGPVPSPIVVMTCTAVPGGSAPGYDSANAAVSAPIDSPTAAPCSKRPTIINGSPCASAIATSPAAPSSNPHLASARRLTVFTPLMTISNGSSVATYDENTTAMSAAEYPR